jgi:hypothetical protein
LRWRRQAHAANGSRTRLAFLVALALMPTSRLSRHLRLPGNIIGLSVVLALWHHPKPFFDGKITASGNHSRAAVRLGRRHSQSLCGLYDHGAALAITLHCRVRAGIRRRDVDDRARTLWWSTPEAAER